MTVAVYPVRPGEGNEELRYSLRSLANAGIDQVVIFGHKPGWVRNVEHVPVTQVGYPAKRRNVRRILEAMAAEAPDEFVFFNDDFYVMKPTTIVPVHRGNLAELVASKGDDLDAFFTCYREASKLLGPTALAYDDLHSPLPLTREGLAEALRVFPHTYGVRTVAGNLLELGGEWVPNAKSPPGFRRRLYLSSSDKSFLDGEMGAYIRETFPDPSPFE